MDNIGQMLQEFLSVNSVGSVAVRAFLWFLVAIVIIASTDTAGAKKAGSTLKSNLGLLLMFFVLAGGLIYLMFGFVPIT